MDRGFGIQPAPFPRGAFVQGIGDHGGGWPDGLAWTIFALLLVLLLIAIVALALDAYHRSRPVALASQPAQPAAGSLAVLDMRYARGEIEREAYVQARSDLGGPEATTVVMPATTEPAAPPGKADS
jgi:uncharacterized membrane protein